MIHNVGKFSKEICSISPEMDDKIVALINLISPHKTNVSDSLAS